MHSLAKSERLEVWPVAPELVSAGVFPDLREKTGKSAFSTTIWGFQGGVAPQISAV